MKVVSADSVTWKREGQWYRAMNPLERLQRRRQGETVPPPLTREVVERV